MNRELFKKSNKIEKFTFIFDFISIIAYISLFLMIFGMLQLPLDPVTGEVSLEKVETVTYSYSLFGNIVSNDTMNLLMSLLVIFMIVSVPMFVVNIKKLRTRTIYEVDSYVAASKFTQAIINLLSLNIVGAVLRIWNMFVLIDFVKGYKPLDFFKSIIPAVKAKFKELTKKKEKLEDSDYDEATLTLKKNIRRQNIAYVFRLLFTYLFLIFMALIIVIPFYWMILTSLKSFTGATKLNPDFYISLSQMNWVNFKVVLEALNFGLYIKNTVIVAVFSTMGTIITTILSAYAFARIEFKGRELLFSILIMTMMIPGELFVITNFITVSKNGLGWIGSGNDQYFLAMIIPFITSISFIFFLRQNFKQIPESLYKAARVDGCSDFKYLTRVMVPIASPTIFTITILNVFSSWNAYIWPRIITGLDPITGKDYWLISNALRDASFVQEGTGRVMYNLQIAASTLVTVPLLIVFFAFRKYIMNGIGRSGTKG
ncbi:carbohydrate ABC transporter permease [Hujiaoplasma nucleasis]|uniref:Carbohydrate ABC transporter permease n=1 Tax=Hujiaoplasma nucleasis TaxID=2725268 RepID=A0A7L6N788_9MOLU|nr:carbohydrate ABC transporter permease [Hujiaoplasma nucleasis]QLY40419.1 carbohydrate ABC transporter permease [Hujiaoplasma nucleasis]